MAIKFAFFRHNCLTVLNINEMERSNNSKTYCNDLKVNKDFFKQLIDCQLKHVVYTKKSCKFSSVQLCLINLIKLNLNFIHMLHFTHHY